MNNEKIQQNQLDIILQKKQNLDATILACEKRIDEKLTALIDEGFLSDERTSPPASESIQNVSQPVDHFLDGIDISDDDALDRAVLNTNPFENPTNRLAFENDLPLDRIHRVGSIPSFNASLGDDDDDDELPTLSKVLGRTTPFTPYPESPSIKTETGASIPAKPVDAASISPSPEASVASLQHTPIMDSETKVIPEPSELENVFDASVSKPVIEPSETISLENIRSDVDSFEKGKKKKPKITKEKPAPKTKPKAAKQHTVKPKKETISRPEPNAPSIRKPSLTDMVFPLVFFFMGVVTFGVFLIFAAPDFNFIDYSVVFILFTCLIFTLAMPYGASMFFMALLLCSYIALSFISIFYLGVQFELYQIGWMLIIPMVLSSSALLLKKVRELFNFKRMLENQIASYDNIEDSTGLTIEKAYYKDLKYAMDRASKGETTLTLEMITICHLDALKSMNGTRLWDEILYKTLKIIKQQCYSTHLIYILDGSVFSILMENTSVKNQLLINQEITDAFAELIKEYDSIDAEVTLNIASLPYTRDITNPLDYRALVLRHLNN